MTFKTKALQKGDLKKLIIFLFLLFSLFSPHLSILGVYVKTVYFFIVMPAFFGGLIILKNMNLLKAEVYFLLAILGALFFSILVSWMAYAVDISQIAASIRGILLFFCAYFFVNVYKRIYKENFFDVMLLHILYAVMVNSILILLLFLIPDIKPIWHSIFILSDTQDDMAMRNDIFVRLSGLVHVGFGGLSVVNAIGFVIALYLYLYSPYKTISLRKFVFYATILFVATILVGRLGLVIIMMSMSLVLLSIRSKRLLLRYFKMLCLITLIFVLVGITLYINFEERFIYGFLTIFDLFLQGKLDTSASYVLSERFAPGLTFKEWLIGTGDYSLEYIDSGYIRLISGGGIFGFMITYFFMIIPIVFVVKKALPYGILVLLIAFPVITLVINIKNVYYFAYNDIFQIYILIVMGVFKLDLIKSISIPTANLNQRELDS
jgi:hypothetical protein